MLLWSGSSAIDEPIRRPSRSLRRSPVQAQAARETRWVRHQFVRSGAQSDKSVSRKRFVRLEAKPYKASDSGFALTCKIDRFFGTISGWRDEARRRDMASGMAQHGSQNGRAGLFTLAKTDWPPSDHAVTERRGVYGERASRPERLAGSWPRGSSRRHTCRSPVLVCLGTNRGGCSRLPPTWSRPAWSTRWPRAFIPRPNPDRCSSVTRVGCNVRMRSTVKN